MAGGVVVAPAGAPAVGADTNVGRRPAVRVAAAGVALLAVYAALSLLMDPRAFLGTDTGGKIATLRAMEETGSLVPDVGYWAEEWDPDGSLHPLYYTFRVGEHWVNATTLPMLYAAYPLWQLGGYRAALLLPMAGAVAAAFAARALARRLGRGSGWSTFWLVGLASPMAVYALDFWEHTWGVALGAWGVVFLLDVAEGARWPRALAAGALFGLAATMRTEALVYAAVTAGVFGSWMVVRRQPFLHVAPSGLAAAVGLGAVLLSNDLVERAVFSGSDSIRVDRTTDTAGIAGEEAGSRLSEALVTLLSPRPSFGIGSYVVGAFLLVLLVLVARRAWRDGDRGHLAIALAGAGAIYAVRFTEGLGFVPGLVAATPLAALGLLLLWQRGGSRAVVGVAVAALPLVWMFQPTGGASPQWAGRYLLLSGLLLMVAGVVVISYLPAWARRVVVALAAGVTVFGLVWVSVRTHDVADAHAALAGRREPVLVSTMAHLAREGGGFYGKKRWLTVDRRAELAEAGSLVEHAGFAEFGLVQLDRGDPEPPAIAGWERGATSSVHLLTGDHLLVTTYARE